MECLDILFTSSWYPNKRDEYLGNFVKRHAQSIAKKHRVYVIYTQERIKQKQRNEIEYTQEGNLYTHIVYFKPFFTNTPLLYTLSKWFSVLRAYMIAYKAVKQKTSTINIIHHNVLINKGLIAFVLSKYLKKPYIVSEHWSSFLPQSNNKIGIVNQFLCRFLFRRAAAVCPVSYQLKEVLEQQFNLSNITVIPNVVNTDLFKPISKEASKRFTFIHVSNFKKEKNIDAMLSAIKKVTITHPSIHFTIMGDGNIQDVYHCIDKYQIDKHFIEVIGASPIEDVAKKMQHSNAFILFSLYENLPCVVLEALSTGLPVISSKVGDIPRIIDSPYKGILVNINDTNALYQSIIDLYENQALYNSASLHQYASTQFQPLKIAHQYSAVYEQAIKKTTNV